MRKKVHRKVYMRVARRKEGAIGWIEIGRDFDAIPALRAAKDAALRSGSTTEMFGE